MLKRNERANFRHTQCNEYRRALWQRYSPFICRTITWESEYTCRARAFIISAYCRASISATYSATLLSWCPIPLAILCLCPEGLEITTPIAAGPGLPCDPPSTHAINSNERI